MCNSFFIINYDSFISFSKFINWFETPYLQACLQKILKNNFHVNSLRFKKNVIFTLFCRYQTLWNEAFEFSNSDVNKKFYAI